MITLEGSTRSIESPVRKRRSHILWAVVGEELLPHSSVNSAKFYEFECQRGG